jgi:hypothetical protein
MKSISLKKFDANIVQEYSSISRVDELGAAKCTMELFLSDDRQRGEIEWIIEFVIPVNDPRLTAIGINLPDEERVEHIGLTFDDRGNLEDYDGVMALPLEAVTFLREQGFTVGPDFDDYAEDGEVPA